MTGGPPIAAIPVKKPESIPTPNVVAVPVVRVVCFFINRPKQSKRTVNERNMRKRLTGAEVKAKEPIGIVTMELIKSIFKLLQSTSFRIFKKSQVLTGISRHKIKGVITEGG